MKLALLSPIGPLDRYGYQNIYPVALESFSLLTERIYLVSSTRNNANVEGIKKQFPKLTYISNEETWYKLDDDGNEIFDIFQLNTNLDIGVEQIKRDGMDAVFLIAINNYIPEKAIPLLYQKAEKMLADGRPVEWGYRRFQIKNRLFVPDLKIVQFINLQIPKHYHFRFDWTESPDGEKLPRQDNGLFHEGVSEAVVDCAMEMTVKDLQDKLNFIKGYIQLNPNALPKFTFKHNVEGYYLPKYLDKTIARDSLDRFGQIIAQNSAPDFVSSYLIRQYFSPRRRMAKFIFYLQRKLSNPYWLIKSKANNMVSSLSKKVKTAYYRFVLFGKVGKRTTAYKTYLDAQLNRTLQKKEQGNPLKLHTQLLVDKLSEFTDLRSASILCIGCRDHAEIDYFLHKNAKKILGIDLYSQFSDILVMDMHEMKFPDNQFDIIYSSHSLEHSFNVDRVTAEILRVARGNAIIAIEVPIQFKVGATDLVDFGSVQNVISLFGNHVASVLWSEELPHEHPRNNQGTAIARAVFSLKK
jgi:SAM-dependent methyltransferase